MEIQYKKLGDHIILELSGDIDYVCLTEFQNTIFNYIKEKPSSLILDLKETRYMDSSSIGLIVSAHKRMNSYGGKFGLLNVQDDVLLLLGMVAADKIIKIYKDETEIK